MYPPGQQMTVRDGGTGLASASNSLPLVVGYARGGTANTLYTFSSSNALRDTLLDGPAVEQAAPIAGRGGCMVLCTTATTVGSVGTVAVSRASTSTGTVTVAGVPANIWKLRIKITATGTVATGKFQYALDGYSQTDAYTWSAEYVIPTGGTFAIPGTTLVATFVPGAGPTYFELGDTHRADCVAPHYTTADLLAAFTALPAQMGTRRVRRVLMAGISQTAAGAVVLAAALAGHLDTLALNWHFARAIMDGGSVDSAASFKTAIASFTDDRIGIVFGKASIVSEAPIPSCGVPELPASNAVNERFAFSDLSENLGRLLSGSLRGIVRISHDERFQLAFTEADRIITLRTHDGYGGHFVTNGYIRSAPSSDFKYIDWGLVIDEICETVHDNLVQWTLESLDAETDGTGRLSSSDASRVESGVQIALQARLMQPLNKSGKKGHCTALQFKVDRTNDFFSTGTIQGAALAIPKRPVETIATQVGFVRQLAAA